MSGFKRFCYILYVFASAFVFLALALTWFGPWTHQATNLLFTKPYLIALNACAAVSIFGLVVVLFRALFIRKTVKLTVATVEGGTISVTRDAISSQAAHIIEEDGTCLAHRVNVQISKNNTVSVQIDILPKEPVDVTAKGSEFYSALQSGLAIVCGPCVSSINLSFIKPSSFSSKDEKTASQTHAEESEVEPENSEGLATCQPVVPQTDKDIRLTISEPEVKEVNNNGAGLL